jgi:DNA-directed RNA polymerase specialized sigma24 family protein
MEISHMPHSTDLQSLTLAGIAHRCARETERYLARQAYDPRYCFELFRRAFLHRDQRAWEHLYNQYHPLVAGWVRRHPAFSSTDEEVDYFVNRALEKMWVALTPEKFGRFADLKSLLRYLQMCVHSEIIDVVRANERAVLDIQEERLAALDEGRTPAVERAAMDQIQRQELWREIDARMRNDKERKVVYGYYVLALKPRELYAQYQDMFGDVTEVYRVKENVLARLRRDAELEKLFAQDA